MLGDIDLSLTPQEYKIVLCKPNREKITTLSEAYNIEYKNILVGANELSFTIPSKVYNKDNPNWDIIKGNYLILLNDKEYFIVGNPQYNDNTKEFICLSQEFELNNKRIVGLDDTLKLYDAFSPEKGVLNYIISLCPSWSIGTIDNELLGVYRTFNISEKRILGFMYDDLQTSFDCIFEFDTLNKIINAKKIENIGENKGLYISEQNLIKKFGKEILDDQIRTRLYLYGKDELSIRELNSTGQPYIENFDYFKTIDYMSKGLINALNSYEALQIAREDDFKNYLSNLDNLYEQLIIKQSKLKILKGELESIQDQIDIKTQSGEDYDDLNTQKRSKQNEINNKQNEIDNIDSQIDDVYVDINSLKDELAIENNFTTEQLKELDYFVKQETFRDNNYYDARDLYKKGKEILAKISKPRFQFKIDVVDFLNIIEYQHDWDKLIIGDLINIKYKSDNTFIVRLIGYTHNPDDNKLTLQFSNKNRYDDPDVELDEILNKASYSSTTLDIEKFKYGRYFNVDRNPVLKFINSSLDASKNNVLAGKNQSILINDRGIWCREFDDKGNINPKQIRILNNSIVVSKDNFKSASTAINGDGVIADMLVGRILIGSELLLENSSGGFKVDKDGVVISNMDLNLTRSDNKSRILLDSSNGFKIQTYNSGWGTKFYADTNGNLVLDGTLRADDILLSGRSILNNSNKINGQYIENLNASTITTGYLNADRIKGGTISGINISGIYINGGTITSANIQTGFEKNKMVFNKSGLISYNSKGMKHGLAIERYDAGTDLRLFENDYPKAMFTYVNNSVYLSSNTDLRIFATGNDIDIASRRVCFKTSTVDFSDVNNIIGLDTDICWSDIKSNPFRGYEPSDFYISTRDFVQNKYSNDRIKLNVEDDAKVLEVWNGKDFIGKVDLEDW